VAFIIQLSVTLNLFQGLPRLSWLLSLQNGKRGRFRIKYGMTFLFNTATAKKRNIAGHKIPICPRALFFLSYIYDEKNSFVRLCALVRGVNSGAGAVSVFV